MARRAGGTAQACRPMKPLAPHTLPTSGRVVVVSRHRGALDWLVRQGVSADQVLAHLSLECVRPGDVVVGTLPVHLAAELCARGARYFHLRVDLTFEQRGRELTAEEMESSSASLQEYRVEREPTHPVVATDSKVGSGSDRE